MRIERQDRRLQAPFDGYFAHASQNSPVTGVYAVEVTHGERRRRELPARLLQISEDADPLRHV